MRTSQYASLRSAAVASLCFDRAIQSSFVAALRDEELNFAPRRERILVAVGSAIDALYAMPAGWHYEEAEVERAMNAVNAFRESI